VKSVSNVGSPFEVEVRYFNSKGEQVSRIFPIIGEGDIVVAVGGKNDIHQVHIRARGPIFGQIIEGFFDLGLTSLPGKSSSTRGLNSNQDVAQNLTHDHRSVALGSNAKHLNAAYNVQSLSPAAARRAIEAAKADDAFSKRYVGSDRDAVDYMHALHRAAYPNADTVVGPSVRPDAGDSSAGGISLQARDTTPARQALEAAKSDDGFVKRYVDGDRNAFAQMQSLIQAAYPEPDAPGSGDATNGASTPMFQPWTPETATEGLQPWMQSSLKDYLSRSPNDEDDGSSKLAPWMRDLYPDWLPGS
jgi:hypothetical protein